MKECPRCHQKADERSRFCNHCGKELIPILSSCEKCQGEVMSADLFCKNCGINLVKGVKRNEPEEKSQSIPLLNDQIYLTNDRGMVVKADIGFSWWAFLFGCFFPLAKSDFKWAAIICLISIVVGVIFYPLIVVVWIVFGFVYNDIYIKERLGEGYYPSDSLSKRILAKKSL